MAPIKSKKYKLRGLGHSVSIPSNPAQDILETVPNPAAKRDFVVRFTCPEFTCLCPITGQPDFAHFVIDYVPAEKIVESKSLKLFLHSFRNHKAFHEACTIEIADRLLKILQPKWFRLGGYWYPRGGIPIDIFFETGKAPKNIWIPDQDVAPYRGRI